jgi:hypothetical protein
MPATFPFPSPLIPDITEDLGVGEDERSDYRAVPRSDTGETYRDRGMLGSFSTNRGEPFPPPGDAVFFTGYGGDMADLKRGYCDPLITQDPGYNLSNYKDRSSQPKVSDLGPGDVEMMPDDWEFRNRNRRSEGFLTRPRIPTERG